MTADRRVVGARIRDACRVSGVSQRELAAKSGISYRGLVYAMSGRHYPSVDTLIRICAALGASADEILGIKCRSNPNA